MNIPREVLIERKRYKEWQEYFKPIKNTEGPYEVIENYEVSAENREKLRGFEPRQLWSVVQGDDGAVLISGFWDHDEVFDWIVTEKPWSGEPASYSIDLAVRVWCRPCDSSGETKAGVSCDKCDGDGYKIYDVES
jgi:hypothetical protein